MDGSDVKNEGTLEMNANELADLKEFEKMLSVGYLPAVKQAIEMLCEQQAEIEALKDKLMLAKQSLEIVEGWIKK